VEARRGCFELATGGSVFLDEVGCLPLPSQSKLLRVLETGEFRRVGGEKTQKADARLIMASNEGLEELVAAGRFRADLFYRLNVLPVRLPPLRERRSDIPLLAQYFSAAASRELGRPPLRLSAGVLQAMSSYPWPGNVRELKNEMERLVVFSPAVELPAWQPPAVVTGDDGEDLPPLRDRVREFEAGEIRQALRRTGGNVVQAARLLGIPRSVLYDKARRGAIRLSEEEGGPPARRHAGRDKEKRSPLKGGPLRT
jgi:DNA-binding NtrC family response regulator